MKIKIKFTLFFFIGLLFFIFYSGLVMLFFFDLFLPLFRVGSNDNLNVFLIVFTFALLSGGMLFSRFFIHPLVFILSITNRLSEGKYDISAMEETLYNKRGKLKKKYILYSEAIDSLNSLSTALLTAKDEHRKLEKAKKDWISGISHDIKTPLSYIVGYSALLSNKDYSFEENEIQNYLAQINTKGKYLENLVEDLNLSFMLTDGEARPPFLITDFDLIRFLREVIADVASIPYADGFYFSFDADQSGIQISADKKLLYRAFQNILQNAVRHNPTGTHIDICVKSSPEGIVISISDNGIGFSKEDAAKIFDRYSKAAEGSGLGLSIVKEIIKAHNGNIYAKSQPDIGSTFYVSLPCYVRT